MKTLGPAIKVGITFLLVLAGGYWSFMMLAKGNCAGEPVQLRLHAYFKDATLLVEKSRVQISGLNIGHITSRELNVAPPRPALQRQKRFAKITIALNRPVTLYSNARVFKRSASLLGDFYLELDPGTYDWVDEAGKHHRGEKLKDGDEIRFVTEAATTSAVVDQVNDLLPTIKQLVQNVDRFTQKSLLPIGKNINEAISENRKAIRSIMANIERITGDVRGITVGAQRDVRRILTDIRTITHEVRTLVKDPNLSSRIKSGVAKLTSAVDKLDKAMGNAQTVSDDVKGITADVRSVTADLNAGKGTIGRLLKDDALIETVEDTVRDVGSLIKGLSGLQTVVGLRSEYNFQAGTIKTYLSIELRPRPDKYYLIELIDDPRGKRAVSTDITRSTDPSKPLVVRTDNVRLTDAFRVTFQFAKTISFATFRFGIKESTGGVGLDLSFFNKDLQIWTDVFDSQANVFPRLKVLAAWRFFSNLYVLGGVDDAFNERPKDGIGGGRDFFLGLSLRFNDQDLKSLLLVGGNALGGVTN